MKNNSHNAKQAPSKAAKPKHDNDVNKAKPKRVKKKAAVKAKLSAEKSDVDFIKIAKSGLHESNAHRGRYDFKKLIASEPALASFVIKNPKGEDSINFSDPNAVKMLNKALL
ncbi:TPA: RlmF-related methyltransferase, partial [Vibrio parahaemolyticus]